MGSMYAGHTIIARGPMESHRLGQNVLSGLCGPFPNHVAVWLGDGGAPKCQTCELLEQVWAANMPFEWAKRVPFAKGGTNTIAARYWLLSILKQTEDSEVFSRWQAAKTFDYLQEQMAKRPRPSDFADSYDVGIFPCCHYCGAEAKHGFPGSVCGVCEGKILTRPAMSIATMYRSITK